MNKILLVEDNEMNRDMLARRLQRRGYEVLVALDGQQAVDMSRSESFDIILMDLSLPVMDGWEATRQIKAHGPTSEIPIIALTAHALETDRTRALETGCDAFETKPVDIGSLLSTIKGLLGQ
ncbi:response regulator [Bradymonas sediminis]|uniref:Response regulator n=1 Tax=Bradymonas sediminis TaxID=1548548 RepID=A0A2Z4FJE2_9DELT|nr:response regulator [Bradymonas sediminis]AWV88816.1 response regulator [Bradymonas sediminis]TDP71817.1 response regulator receiver domain-containing protein [Bradymonas sediminis]